MQERTESAKIAKRQEKHPIQKMTGAWPYDQQRAEREKRRRNPKDNAGDERNKDEIIEETTQILPSS